ncbi:MAG: RluA family pseudouridine synthase [Halothiobacillaceae bacterium]
MNAPGASDSATAVRHVTIDERNDGQRLDNFLLAVFRGAPRSLVYRILRKGEVRVNRKRAKASQRLQHGDLVRLPPVRLGPDAPAVPIPAAQIARVTASILHEDNALIVLNKPPGLAVHRGSGVGYGVIDLLRAERGADEPLELVHRLDRETSGCLLLAKSRSALLRLQAQMGEAGGAEKRYWAIVSGQAERVFAAGASRSVTLPLRKNTLRGGERMVQVDHREGKPARTDFRCLTAGPRAALLEATLHTGRTHQVRVHAASLGLPIVGDDKYGDADFDRAIRAEPTGFRGMALHAATLAIDHPETGIRQHFSAPVPERWGRLADELGIALPQLAKRQS